VNPLIKVSLKHGRNILACFSPVSVEVINEGGKFYKIERK
jgi:hypothetical protein